MKKKFIIGALIGTGLSVFFLMPRASAYLVNTGGALHFDGSTGYVSIPNPSSTFPWSQPTTGALTICSWINPDTLLMSNVSSDGYVHFLSKVDSGKTEWTFRMYSYPTSTQESPVRFNRISFYVYSLSGGEGAGGAFEDQVIPGQWIFVCGTVDGTNVSIWKNGIFQAATNWVTYPVTLTTSTATLRIGTGKSGDGFFQGGISDVQIWNRVLSPVEMRSLYLTNTSITNGLVGQWKLSEGSGTTAFDTSGLGNNGTINGSTTWLSGVTQSRVPTNGNAFSSFGQYLINRTNSIPQRLFQQNMSSSIKLVVSSTQYLNIASGSATAFNTGNDDFMFGGWFKIGDAGAFQHLMAKYSSSTLASNAGAVGWELVYRGDTTKGLNVRLNDGTNENTFAWAPYNISDQWLHITVVVMRTDNQTTQQSSTITLYIDGVRNSGNDRNIESTTGSLSSTGNFTVGHESGTGTQGLGNFEAHDLFFYDFGVGGLPTFQTLQTQYIDPIYYQNVFPTSYIGTRNPDDSRFRRKRSKG